MKQSILVALFTWACVQLIVGIVFGMTTFLNDHAPCERARTRLFKIAFPVKPLACAVTYWLEEE